MLTEVKNQIKVVFLSTKYAIEREMLNKLTFISNILFMILNNASFIIQWIVIYSIKNEVGGYVLKDVILLWGMAAFTYGISRFFFKNAFNLSDTITNGKLDAFLVQPKNVLLSSITSDIEISALGDLLYGYIMLLVYGLTFKNLLLFTFFGICGGLIITSIAIIFASLSFWFRKADMISDTANSLMVNFATYPDGIFKGTAKVILYTIVPVGISTYMPVNTIRSFNIELFLIVIVVCITIILLANIIFNRGLKRYSSSNLMISRI